MAGLANLSEFFENPLFTETIREVPVETGYIGSRFLPSEDTYDMEWNETVIERQADMADLVDAGAELPLTDRDPVRRVSGSIADMGQSYILTKKELAAMSDKGNEGRRKMAVQQVLKKTAQLIGNLTSQLLANVYLNELDQFCKKVLGTKFYIRYMDDVIILSQSKEELHEIKERISKFLDEELQLALNKKTCIRPVSMGIQFVGLHIWSTHRTVRKSTSLRIKRRLKAAAKQYVAGNLTYERYNSTLQSYMGMMKHNDCYRFKMQLLEDVETIINESGVAA